MSLRIFKGGVMDTIQDKGRFGYRHQGINPAGAMDCYAMQLANMLVGNDPAEAVIEMHFPPGSFFFEEPALIALTGADFIPTINAEQIPMDHPILVNKFGILQFEGIKRGARAYLSVRGGIKVPPWLNSCSTHLKARTGGFEGRILHKDDEINVGLLEEKFIKVLAKKEFMVFPWKAARHSSIEGQNHIPVIPGNEWSWLSTESKNNFEVQPFCITVNADRMGYRLEGESLKADKQEELISSAVTMGTVQLLPDGKLILLMADHQTTGGYPRIAHVISAAFSKLAQMKTGDQFYFKFTDLQTAEKKLIEQQQYLQQLAYSCLEKLEKL